MTNSLKVVVSFIFAYFIFFHACVFSTPLYFAAGSKQISSTNSAPFLVSSADNGATWQSNIVYDNGGTGFLFSNFANVSCLDDVTCVTGGTTYNGQEVKAIIEVTNNGSIGWQEQDVAHLISVVKDLSCASSATHSICAIVGANFQDQAVILTTADDAKTWQVENIANAPKHSELNAVKCAMKGSTPFCIAVGDKENAQSLPTPWVIIKADTSNTWQQKTVNSSSPGIFYQVNCTKAVGKKYCYAFGHDPYTHPLLASSQNGGETWQFADTEGLGGNVLLKDESCVGSFCVTVGSNAGLPVLGVSHDGGITWQSKTIKGVSGNGVLSSVSCAKVGKKTQCMAIGGTETVLQLVAISNDNGQTWQLRQNSAWPETTQLKKVQAFLVDQQLTYLVASEDRGVDLSYINVTQNEGKTWTNAYLPLSDFRAFAWKP